MYLSIVGRRLKILHVISELQAQKGGPAVALLGFVKAQKSIGHLPTVVWTSATANSPDESAALKRLDVPFVKIAPCRTSWLYSSKTHAVLRGLIHDADVVHGHGVYEHILFAAATIARSQGKPFVLRTCGILDRHSFRHGWLKKHLYLWLIGNRTIRRASALHLLTDFESKNLHPLALGRPQVILPNGVEITDMPRNDGERSMAASHAPFILFLGRLHPKKGVDILLHSFAKLSRNNLRLLIVGEGDASYVDELKQLVITLGLGERIKFLGAKFGPEKYELMREASCMVLPSRDENFANVVIETLGVGTPVIVSEHVGLADFVASHKLGSVCKLDAEDLAHKISTLDVGDRSAFALRACKLVKELFSWNEIALQWQRRYHAMIVELSNKS